MISSVTGGTVVYGLCVDCLPEAYEYPVEALDALTRAELNELPYGIIRLDADNRVVEYNRAESGLSRRDPSRVLGRDFFVDVAPCTNVKELAGWLEERRLRRFSDVTRLSFAFEFPFGNEVVELSLSYSHRTGFATLVVRSRRHGPAAEA